MENCNKYKTPHISNIIKHITDKYNLNFEEVALGLKQNFPELYNKERCANCGASMKAHSHTLSSGLVGDLIKAIEFVKSNNRNSFHLNKDFSLTKSQYNNFQKLRFFGLITQDDKQEESGYWLITTKGGKFLRGEIGISKKILTFRNRIEKRSEELVWIKDFLNQYPRFQTEFAYEIQQGKLL